MKLMNHHPRRWNTASDSDLDALLTRECIEFVHAGLFDTEGVFREKRLPVELARKFLREGWSFIDALPFWGPNDAVRADRPYRSEACRFDPASVRPYPFEPDSVLLVADYTGDCAALSPRSLLAAQIAALQFIEQYEAGVRALRIGGPIVLLAIGGLVFWLVRRRRAKRAA